MNISSLANTHLSLQSAVSTKKLEKSHKGICVQFVFSTCLILYCIGINNSLFAQHPGFEFIYPGPHAESARGMTATSDGDFVMTGHQGINVGISNIALRKVNPEGEEQWIQYFGNGGSNNGNSVIENAWGNIVVAGQTNESTPAPNHHEAYLAEYDENGVMIWEKSYPHPAGSGGFSVVKPTTDLGYVVAGGQVNLINENSNTDVFVIKADVIGDTMWTCSWGTPALDYVHDLVILTNGSILCAGVTRNDFGFYNMLLLKLSSLGELIWEKTYDFEGHDEAYSVAVDSQGNIILGGYSGYTGSIPYELPKICVVKTDSLGNLIWYKKYGGNKDDHVRDIILDSEDNIYAVGNSSSYKPPGSPISGYAGFLKKLNTEGDSLWTRVFYEGSTVFFNQILPTQDNGFMICGGRNSRMYLVRTDEWGCVEEGCELNTSVSEFENYIQISAWPNPTNGHIQIRGNNVISEDHYLEVFDVNGRIIKSWSNPLKELESQRFDFTKFSNGVYFLKLVSTSGEGQIVRLVKN